MCSPNTQEGLKQVDTILVIGFELYSKFKVTLDYIVRPCFKKRQKLRKKHSKKNRNKRKTKPNIKQTRKLKYLSNWTGSI
jgi:hypothetical protein